MRSEQVRTGMSIPPRPGRPPASGTDVTDEGGVPLRATRAGMVWVATVSVLVALSLLIILILQNQDLVQVQYLGLSGSLPLGVGLFIAAVAGGLLVAAAGAVRITQLRIMAARARPHRDRTRAAARPHLPGLKRGHPIR